MSSLEEQAAEKYRKYDEDDHLIRVGINAQRAAWIEGRTVNSQQVEDAAAYLADTVYRSLDDDSLWDEETQEGRVFWRDVARDTFRAAGFDVERTASDGHCAESPGIQNRG